MKNKIHIVLAFGVAACMMSACTNTDVGTTVGAASGAGLGYAVSGGSGVGTLVGAGAGGLIGNAIGKSQDRRAYFYSMQPVYYNPAYYY